MNLMIINVFKPYDTIRAEKTNERRFVTLKITEMPLGIKCSKLLREMFKMFSC